MSMRRVHVYETWDVSAREILAMYTCKVLRLGVSPAIDQDNRISWQYTLC